MSKYSNELKVQREQVLEMQAKFDTHGLLLDLTSTACPEQYSVFKAGKQVGYLRLRHGEFKIVHPTTSGEILLQTEAIGDGMFLADERIQMLQNALELILEKLNGN